MNNTTVPPEDRDNDTVHGDSETAASASGGSLSTLAMNVLESASKYQAGASNRRIASGPSSSKNAKSSAMGLHQFKNLGKAKNIQAERKSKKAEARLLDSGIRVAATLWMTDKNKLRQVRSYS